MKKFSIPIYLKANFNLLVRTLEFLVLYFQEFTAAIHFHCSKPTFSILNQQNPTCRNKAQQGATRPSVVERV